MSSARRRHRMHRSAVIGLPLLMLVAGGATGWFTRDTGGGDGGAAPATVVGGPFPTDIDAAASVVPLLGTANPAVIDPTEVIGFDTSDTLAVPVGGAIALPLGAADRAAAVDARTFAPVAGEPPPPMAAVDAEPADTVTPLEPPASTLPPPDGTPPPVTGAENKSPSFVDRCYAGDEQCAGQPGMVRPIAETDPAARLDPLQLSLPLAAANGYAALCASVEGDRIPDPFLQPATRPTIAVIVNQPSTLALTGRWADGAELAKVTMVTSPAHDAQWQQAWDDGQQQRIIACITLPLEQVRTHADGGAALLQAEVVAISANGRAQIAGQVTLHIPIDGEDALYAERVTVADRGEQRHPDGLLYPTVHVHYAVLADALAPAAPTLGAYAQHALVEGADCTGWAVNQQGRDRTAGGSYRVTVEQRTIVGRERAVVVVDGDVALDPTLPGGWEGQLCVRLLTAGADATTATTLSLRGAIVRSPRTAVYAIGAHLDTVEPQDGAEVTAVWSSDSALLCNEATLSPGAVCTTYTRLAPDGIVLALALLDARGVRRPLTQVRVPVISAYCDPTDPFAAVGDGCNTGFVQTLQLPLADDTAASGVRVVRVVINVARTALFGAGLQDPSSAWRVADVTTFTS
jgi:hypothetical protein